MKRKYKRNPINPKEYEQKDLFASRIHYMTVTAIDIAPTFRKKKKN